MAWGSISGVSNAWSSFGSWTTVNGSAFNVTWWGQTVSHRVAVRWRGRTHTSQSNPRSEIETQVRWEQTQHTWTHFDTVGLNANRSTSIGGTANTRGAFRLVSTTASWSTSQLRTINHNASGALGTQALIGRIWVVGGDIAFGDRSVTANTGAAPTVAMIVPPTRSTAAAPANISATGHPTADSLSITVTRGGGTNPPFHRGRFEIERRSDGNTNTTTWTPDGGNAATGNVAATLGGTNRFRFLMGSRFRVNLNSFTTATSTVQVGTTHNTAWATIEAPARSTATVANVSVLSTATTAAVVVAVSHGRNHAQIRVRLIMERQNPTGSNWTQVMTSTLWNPTGNQTMTISAANLSTIRSNLRDATSNPMRVLVITEATSGTSGTPSQIEQIGATQTVNFTLTLPGNNPTISGLTLSSRIQINRVRTTQNNVDLPVITQHVTQTGTANFVRSLGTAESQRGSWADFNSPTPVFSAGATQASQTLTFGGRTVATRDSVANISQATGTNTATLTVIDNRGNSGSTTTNATVLNYALPLNTSTISRTGSTVTVHYITSFTAVNPNIPHGNVTDIAGTANITANITTNSQVYRGFRWRSTASGAAWSNWSANITAATSSIAVGAANDGHAIDVEIAHYDRFRGNHVVRRVAASQDLMVIDPAGGVAINAPRHATELRFAAPGSNGARVDIVASGDDAVLRMTSNTRMTGSNLDTFTMHNDGNVNGHSLTIQSGGNVFLGSGESPRDLRAIEAAAGLSGNAEMLYLTSDRDTWMYTYANTIGNRRRTLGLQQNGRISAPFTQGTWDPRLQMGDTAGGPIIGANSAYDVFDARWFRFGNFVTVTTRFDVSISNTAWSNAWAATTSMVLCVTGLPAPIWGIGASAALRLNGLSWVSTATPPVTISALNNNPLQNTNVVTGGGYSLVTSVNNNAPRFVIRVTQNSNGTMGCTNLTRGMNGTDVQIMGSRALGSTTGNVSTAGTARVVWRFEFTASYLANSV